MLSPSSAPQAPLPPNTATSPLLYIHLLHCWGSGCVALPPPTFGIAALSPARAPRADREMASPFTPGKRSGTKGAAGGITTRGRGEVVLQQNGRGYHLCWLDTLISSSAPRLSCIDRALLSAGLVLSPGRTEPSDGSLPVPARFSHPRLNHH